MKSIADLTELEALKLQISQGHLKTAAYDFVCHPRDHMAETMLFTAAREFHRVCDEIGFQDYWPAPIFVVPESCEGPEIPRPAS